MRDREKTSWEHVSDWYGNIVGKHGHDYHQELIFPKLIPLLDLKGKSVLDLGCGQGVLARYLPKNTEFYGVDSSPSLIKAAQKLSNSPLHHFITADATQPISIAKKDFDYVTVILAVQDMQDVLGLFKNAARHLKKGGRLVIVMNHPCYRIPRQSSWGVDEGKKLQYRRMDAYMQPMKIPISTQPSQGARSPIVHYFHHPLSQYFSWLAEAGFLVEGLEEWVSEKQSEGRKAKMENRSREEFPLFLCLIAVKN